MHTLGLALLSLTKQLLKQALKLR